MRKLGMVAVGLALMTCLAGSAQATQTRLHWAKNGGQPRILEGTKEKAFAWGTLTVEAPSQTLTCHVAEAENVFNVTPHEENESGAQAEAIAFMPYVCVTTAGSCPVGETKIHPTGLPWSQEAGGSELTEWTKTYKNIGLVLECEGYVAHEEYVEPTKELCSGNQTTGLLEGLTGAKPTEVTMKSSSLNAISGGCKVKGKMKLVAYEGTPIPVLTLQEGKP